MRRWHGSPAALLLFSGLLIIAHHQYWSSLAAILISLFGWFLALRGVVLLAAPQLIERAAGAAMNMMPIVRIGFGAARGDRPMAHIRRLDRQALKPLAGCPAISDPPFSHGMLPPMGNLYDQDLVLWSEEQARALRAAAERRLERADRLGERGRGDREFGQSPNATRLQVISQS